jgi:hypothetical protein
LEKSPRYIALDFDCSFNLLTSLEFCPEYIGRNFDCSYNNLTTLKGCPEKVKNRFDCYGNNLTSLEGCPKIVENGGFYCTGNSLSNLHDIHKHLHSCKYFDVTDNPLESHILGLLKIDKLERVFIQNRSLAEIINKYLPLGDIFECQSELIEAGYEEFAKL